MKSLSPWSVKLNKQREFEKLSWLAGTWKGRAYGGELLETYTPATGHIILGATKIDVENKTVYFEIVRIEENGEELRFVLVLGEMEYIFQVVEVTDSRLRCENRSLRYPREVLYELIEDRLRIKLTGVDQHDAPKGTEVELFRAKD